MYKIIDLGSEFEQTGEPRARLLDTSLAKTASSAIQDYWSKLEPSSEHSYLWVIGVSAMEYYGCNNNGDAFHEDDLKKTLPDWERQAHIFVHHVNKDPRKAIGKPVFAWYNDEMHRVELVLAIRKDAEGAAQTVAKIKAGEQMYVSMGCNVAYDVCSICGHESHTRAEYCDHLRFNMKKIIPGGKQVYAINPNPHFFDISIVTKPADPMAFALDKMASERVQVSGGAGISKTSAELGDMSVDLMRKAASVHKLADIIKHVDGEIVDDKLGEIVKPVRDIAEEGFGEFEYPEMPYDELERVGTTPLGLLEALGSFGLRPTFDDAYWMSGAGRHGIGFGDALHVLPQVLDILGRHPDQIEPHFSMAFRDGMEDPERHEETVRIVRPIAIQRITIIRAMPGFSKHAAQFGRPDYINVAGRNFAPIRFADKFGHKATTTPYHLKQTGLVTGPWLRGAVATLLAMGAIGGITHAPDLATKVTSGAVFGLPALAMFADFPNSPENRVPSVNSSVEVPVETLNDAFKTFEKGETKTAAAMLGTMAGAAVPAALALDYAYNKWKAEQNGEYPPEHDPLYRAGRFVVSHPGLTTLGGAVGGTIVHKNLRSLFGLGSTPATKKALKVGLLARMLGRGR